MFWFWLPCLPSCQITRDPFICESSWLWRRSSYVCRWYWCKYGVVIYLFLNRNISHRTNKQTDICHIELTAIFISNRIFTVITFLAGMKLSCREFWTIVKIHLKLLIQMLFAAIGWHSEGKERRKEFKPKMMKSGMDTVQREQQFVFKMWFTVSLLLQNLYIFY